MASFNDYTRPYTKGLSTDFCRRGLAFSGLMVFAALGLIIIYEDCGAWKTRVQFAGLGLLVLAPMIGGPLAVELERRGEKP